MAYTHCHKAAMHCELATKRSQPAYTHGHKPTTHCELATKESQRAYPPGHKARMHCDNATKHCWSASTNYDRPNKESRRADTLDGLSVPLVTSAPGNSGPRGRKSRRGAAVREPVAAKKPGSQAQIQRLKQVLRSTETGEERKHRLTGPCYRSRPLEVVRSAERASSAS
jgi:hypothetical protein